jgi:tetratricopeptide (TPR) repeat protein
MSKAQWISVTLLTVVILTGAGPTGFAQEPADEPPTVTFDPLTGQPVAKTEAPPTATEEEVEPRADLSQANDLVRAGDYEAADVELAALQEEFPDDPRLLFMRGEVVQRAAELDADRPRLHFQLAMALLRTGDPDGALEAFAKEIEANEDIEVQIMARLNRTQILAQKRDWAAAAAELEAVLLLDPERSQAYGDMAGFYLQAGELDEATRVLELGLEKGFSSARHHYILGARFSEKKSYDAAVAAYQKAIAIDSELAEAERGLGGALDQLGREQEALAHFRRYLKLKPDAPDAERVTTRVREIEGG